MELLASGGMLIPGTTCSITAAGKLGIAIDSRLAVAIPIGVALFLIL
jgi:predicted cation transporter